MISILVPSRGRPAMFWQMVDSALETADRPIEVVVYRDEDDAMEYEYQDCVTEIRGSRVVLSQMWNECQKVATGDIFMHAGDDIVFKTKGWNTMVEQAFADSKDKILFVHGDDGYWGDSFGTHGLIHQAWIDAVGYFVPPYFSSDYNDTWLNEVADSLGRRVYLPFLTEHMHPNFGKGALDQTHLDRLERGRNDNVAQLYASYAEARAADVQKLQAVIDSI